MDAEEKQDPALTGQRGDCVEPTRRLEEETARRTRCEELLRYEEELNQTFTELYGVLLSTYSIRDISEAVSEVAKRMTDSSRCFIGYIDPATGRMIAPLEPASGAMGRRDDRDRLAFDKSRGICGWIFDTRETLPVDKPGILESSSQVREVVVSQLHVLDSSREFTDHDFALIKRLATFYALAVQRAQTEEKLERSRASFHNIVDNSSDGIIVVDKDGIIRFLNAAAKRMLSGGAGPGEQFGMPITVNEVSEIPMQFHDSQPGIGEMQAVETEWEGDFAYLVTVRDITRRKQTEEQFYHAQKMEAVGTLAGGIAHDFNNILSAIIGYTELSRLDAVPGSTLHANLDQINKAGLRAKELVQQILTFSRQDDIEVKPVKVRALIEESLNFLRASISKTIDIRANIASEAYALASPTQVQQILMNLCTNAAHAMGNHGGIIEVAFTDVVIDRTAFGQDINLPSGDYIRISVRDTGCGMPPQVMERIFDPYFTTKSEGEGSGLGMAVVHGIVSRYGGTIKVCSEESRGTTVNVYLPCQTDATPEKGEASNATPHGKEAILLVDDEPQLVAIENSMLTRLGYRVTTSQDSIEALEIFRRQPTAFDVVVTDMSMPKMNGLEFSQAVLAIRSDTPIIICTGYSAGLTQEKAHSVGVHGILMKPISMQTLAQSIRQAIDGDHISSR
jgi:signal transduction histidine kinase/ActR/RegA family two-component response regulator